MPLLRIQLNPLEEDGYKDLSFTQKDGIVRTITWDTIPRKGEEVIFFSSTGEELICRVDEVQHHLDFNEIFYMFKIPIEIFLVFEKDHRWTHVSE
jgi:hypothetical protein